MLIILSPTKTITKTATSPYGEYTLPNHLDKSKRLVDELKMKGVKELEALMKISPKLAQLNFERFQQWSLPFTKDNANQAVFAFKGEAFHGLDAENFNKDDLHFAQEHLIILSGLYGILRPFDLMQPYRLEMGIKAALGGSKNLYAYWRESITNSLQEALRKQGDSVVINLASNEYFKSIDTKKLKAQIITPEFKENKNGTYRMVTVYVKKARGMMVRFMIQNRMTHPDELKLFDADGYYYNENLTNDPVRPLFTRN